MSEKKKKILVFAKAYPPIDGGVETYSQELAKAYSQLGNQVTVLTANNVKPYIHNENNVMIINVGSGGQISVFFRLLFYWFLNKKKLSPDIIHATTWRVLLPALIVSHSRAIKVVTVHGREVLKINKILNFLKNITLKKSDLIVGVSQIALASAIKTLKNKPSNMLISYNGTSVLKDYPSKVFGTNRKKVVFSLCRLVERKNIINAVRGFERLPNELLLNCDYLIAGDGPMKDSLISYVKKNNLEDKVKILGRVSEERLVELYQEADIFLHPQIMVDNNEDIEGFGITIADAMKHGIPVIVGKDGGPSEFILNNINGLVVDGNNIDEITNSLRSLITKEGLYNSVSKAGLATANEEFCWLRHAKSILEKIVYERC